MSESIKDGNGDNGQEDWRPVWEWINTSGFRMLLAIGAILIVAITILAFTTTDLGVRAAILAAGIPAVLTFIAVVIQAAVAKQMAEIMDRQESEMSKTRQATEETAKLNDKMVTSMQGQLSVMKDGYIETRNLLKQNRQMIDETKRQADATENALKLSERTFYTAERAYLAMTHMFVEQFVAGENIRFRLKITNGGRTPAFNVHLFLQGVDAEGPDLNLPNTADRVWELLRREDKWIESFADHLILPGKFSRVTFDDRKPLDSAVFNKWDNYVLQHWIGIKVVFMDIKGDTRWIVTLSKYAKESGLTMGKSLTGDIVKPN